MLKRFSAYHIYLIGMIILIVLIALPIVTYPMGRDQGMYTNIGNSILRGGVPFVDMWDIKPPPIYYIYALGIHLFGATTEAIRVLDLVFVPIGIIGLYLLGGHYGSRQIGLLAGLLYGAFYFNDGFQNLTQSDSLATIPTIWVAYATSKASTSDAGSRGALVWALVTGMLSGLILWFKPQQYALVIGAFVIFQMIVRLRKNPNFVAIFKEGIAFAIGGLITGGTLLVYFWSQGIIAEIFIVAEGTAAYNAQGYDANAFVTNMLSGVYFRWIVWHGLIVLTGGWMVQQIIGIFRSADSETSNTNNLTLLLILWWVAGLGFAFIQAKGFDTHWFPMLPPMALMGAYFIETIIERVLSSESVKRGLYSVIAVVVLAIPAMTTWGTAWQYIFGQQDQISYWDSFQANDLKPEESLLVTQYLQDRVVAGNSLFIWGFRPEVYFMSGLNPATRYQAHFPLVAPWYPEEWQQNNVDILWAALPPYVLILEDDFMPWVTDFDADSHTLLQDYTELNNWLIANYVREDEIGDFIIWRRQ